MEAERPPLVREPQGAIALFFDLHVRGPDCVVNLIEPPLMGNGEVLPQAPAGLDAQAPGHGSLRSMSDRLLGRETTSVS